MLRNPTSEICCWASQSRCELQIGGSGSKRIEADDLCVASRWISEKAKQSESCKKYGELYHISRCLDVHGSLSETKTPLPIFPRMWKKDLKHCHDLFFHTCVKNSLGTCRVAGSFSGGSRLTSQ